MMSLAGHSKELYALVAGCTVLIGVFGYFHARNFWEGLPPLWDALISMAGFVAVLGAFVMGGRIGSIYGHPHAGRVLAVAAAVVLYRTLRTWIGLRREKYRSLIVRRYMDRPE
jgi:hypothetical protein